MIIVKIKLNIILNREMSGNWNETAIGPQEGNDIVVAIKDDLKDCKPFGIIERKAMVKVLAFAGYKH